MDEPDKAPSKATGACVLVALLVIAAAAVFAVSQTAGVLLTWSLGTFLLWRSARRVSVSSAPPPPEGVAPPEDVYARETGRVARVVDLSSGVGCILHPVLSYDGEDDPEA